MKIFYILTAAAIAIAVPSVAGAQETKGGDMKKPAYHKNMHPHHKNMHTYHKHRHPVGAAKM